MYPRTVVRNRRMEVSTLIAKGYSPGEVAQYLNVSPETVYNDVRFIRSGRNPELVANSVRQRTLQYDSNMREIRKGLWRIVDFGNNDYVKYLSLNLLTKLEEKMNANSGRVEKALSPPVEPPSMDGSGLKNVQDSFRKRYEKQMAEEKFLDSLTTEDAEVKMRNAEEEEIQEYLPGEKIEKEKDSSRGLQPAGNRPFDYEPEVAQPLLDNDNLANDDTGREFKPAENRSFDYEPEVGSTTDDMEEASD